MEGTKLTRRRLLWKSASQACLEAHVHRQQSGYYDFKKSNKICWGSNFLQTPHHLQFDWKTEIWDRWRCGRSLGELDTTQN